MITISVAMRSYNSKPYITQQIQSILNQSQPVDEIIICDDKSTDGTLEILNDFQKKYPNIIQVFVNDKNIGPEENFKKSVSLCSGDIIFLSDADDVWHIDKVKVYTRFFSTHSDALLVFGDATVINANGESLGTTLWNKWNFTPNMQQKWKNNEEAFTELIRNNNKITGPSIALRKRLLESALPTHPDAGYLHDAWLGIFAAKEHGLYFIEQPLLDYRIHEGQFVGIRNASPHNTEKNIICTIIAPNYLAQARALTESFHRHNPDMAVYALIVDTSGASTDYSKEKFIPIFVHDLEIPDLPGMISRYDIRELCTAVKPFFLQHLFKVEGVGMLCYFDPDIYFYNSISHVWRELETHDVVLTPHLLQPLNDGLLPNEFSILAAGTYNLGFIGLRKSDETYTFLTWWGNRLIHYSHGAPERHEHFDQRWIDFIPGFMKRVYIDRHPGMNTAYWDLYNRHITIQNNTYLVNFAPLIFFHFSGYSPLEPEHISRHQNRYSFTEKPELKPLFDAYGKELLRHGFTNKTPKKKTSPLARMTQRNQGYLLYGRLTRFLANLGLESLLVSVLGRNTIGVIRSYFFIFRAPEIKHIRIKNEEGVNIFGLPTAQSGIGSSTRNIAAAIASQHAPMQLHDALHAPLYHEKFKVSILAVNADITSEVVRIQQLKKNRAEYIIGYWWWELGIFPKEWLKSFSAIDELWVGSTFTLNTLAPISPVPVHLMNLPIEPPAGTSLDRTLFGISNSAYVFLFIFDFQSYIERKNPYAVIEAFQRAFGARNTKATLIIKVMSAQDYPMQSKKLQQAVQNINGVYIDSEMDKASLSGLFLMADAYISLHRSEGFGLTMAEAMYFKKPVIATNYSGNTDYMTSNNSYLVNYTLTEITKTVGPYDRGNVWAQPDIVQAAGFMQYLASHPEEGKQKGLQASLDIHSTYNINTTGKLMAQRIESIYEQLMYSK